MSMLNRINEVYQEIGEAVVESGLDFKHKTEAKRFFKDYNFILKLLLKEDDLDISKDAEKELKKVLKNWIQSVNDGLYSKDDEADKKQQNKGESVTDNKQQQQQNQYQNHGA